MEIINLNNPKEVENIKGSCIVGLGNFDGIHLGHQKLIKNVVNNKENLIPSILLFRQHTNETLDLFYDNSYITSLEDKIEILKKLNIQRIFLIKFDSKFMEMGPVTFVEDFLMSTLKAKKVVVGEDYTFAKGGKSDVSFLKKYEGKDFEVIITDEVKFHNEKISSSTIRKDIKEGKFDLVNKSLGRAYKIKGEVVNGYKRGSKMGFPTANIDLSFSYVLPKNGVYITKTYICDEEYYSLTNIGFNPTFNLESKKIESYILDFSENIYGEYIEVEFIEFLRDEIKFDNKNDLINQMIIDEKITREKINIYKDY